MPKRFFVRPRVPWTVSLNFRHKKKIKNYVGYFTDSVLEGYSASSWCETERASESNRTDVELI